MQGEPRSAGIGRGERGKRSKFVEKALSLTDLEYPQESVTLGVREEMETG